MAGFDRYENILKLFTQDNSSWTAPEIAEMLGIAGSTIYRTVRELVAAGFLESAVESHYRLGPAFMAFERTMRVTDPLVRSGVVFLEPMVEQAGVPCSVVLARLYGDRVMCVADACSALINQRTSFERGRPMPILRGATSKAILAGLTQRRRERLFKSTGPSGQAERTVLEAELEQIRKSGISVTSGEVDAGAIGFAAPLKNRTLGIDASLSFILSLSDFHQDLQPKLFSLLTSNARLIENFMDDAYRHVIQRPSAVPSTKIDVSDTNT